jgi:hypothetical protein
MLLICCRDDERIEYYHLISMKHVGDTLNLKVLRDGQVGAALRMDIGHPAHSTAAADMLHTCLRARGMLHACGALCWCRAENQRTSSSNAVQQGRL